MWGKEHLVANRYCRSTNETKETKIEELNISFTKYDCISIIKTKNEKKPEPVKPETKKVEPTKKKTEEAKKIEPTKKKTEEVKKVEP